MTASERLAVAKAFLGAASKSKTSYGATGLMLLPVARWFFGPEIDGAFRLNGFLVNWHWSTDAAVAALAPLLWAFAMWGRSVAEGPLWPAIQPAVASLVTALGQAQSGEPEQPAQESQGLIAKQGGEL